MESLHQYRYNEQSKGGAQLRSAVAQSGIEDIPEHEKKPYYLALFNDDGSLQNSSPDKVRIGHY